MINWKSLLLFYREKYIFSFFNLSLILFLAALTLTIIFIRPQQDLITLHYNFFYGIDYLGYWFMSYIYLLINLLVILLNFIFSYNVFTSDKYMSYYLAITPIIYTIIFNMNLLTIIPF